MTPAINLLKKQKFDYKIHEYQHDAKAESYGLEAAQKLGISAEQVFKTLVVKLDNSDLAVAVLPVDKMLSMKLIAKAVSAKKADMADKQEVQRSTGYVLGGVSPLGQKKRLKTVIDESVKQHQTIFISAGKRGLEIEISGQDLVLATQGEVAIIAV
jgi:Cys-tRNA(Pro)/Cys-tRNA(Cys) deacylase